MESVLTNPNIIRIPDTNRVGAIEEDFISDYPSFSEDNDFIPIHSMTDGELILNKTTGFKNFFYHLNIPITRYYRTKKFSTFANNMFNDGNSWINLLHATISRRYICKNGMLVYIQEEPFKLIPLIVLCVKKRYLFNINRNSPDVSQFCMLVDRKLMLDTEHFKVYRNIKKYYLNVMENLIDIMYSYDITQLCYKNKELSLPKFETMGEMINHTDSINQFVSLKIINS